MYSLSELKKYLKEDLSSRPIIKLALVGDTATQLLATAIRGTGVVRGFNIDLYEAEYNQVEQQTLISESELRKFNADFIVLFQSTHKLGVQYSFSSLEKQSSLADERCAFVSSLCEDPTMASKRLIVFNYPEIGDTVYGSYSNKIESSFTYQVRKLNYALMQLARQYSNLFICDIAELQNKFGRDRMFAPNIYASSDIVFRTDVLPFVASRVMDIVCAIKGQFNKCLILDLDNTLWGGIIGDDGLEGIEIGHGVGIGKMFSEFQLWIKKLKKRGIIVCVVSKNNEDTAKQPFLQHPDMVLKLDDIAVFQANWETKVDNIRTIQKILNIGFDSMVFLDDNPFERSMVRENIEGITVPELPENPEDYLEYLYTLNLFETASYTDLDKDRTKQYQVEATRVAFSKSFSNESDFLKHLNMTSIVSGFTKFNTPRVAQLSQRSNQFNLRTVRYTNTDIEALANDSRVIDLCFTLEDKFGDNGLVAVVIMTPMNQESLFVDSWFMSCRVLNRGMENFILNVLVNKAKEAGYKKIIGEYLPTIKNHLVENHYPQLGFVAIKDGETSQWCLDVNGYQEKECYIKYKSNGQERDF